MTTFKQFILESVDFNVSTHEVRDGKKYIVTHGERKVEIDCPDCKGTGKDPHEDDKECFYCDGKKKITDWVTDSPHLNVANANAHSIITDLLGLEFDYAGVIKSKDLPEVRRRIIKVLNSDKERSKMHKPDTEHKPEMGVKGKKDNVVSIGRTGPRIHEFGRTDEQVLRYAKKMLEIVEYAMKHNLMVSWG